MRCSTLLAAILLSATQAAAITVGACVGFLSPRSGWEPGLSWNLHAYWPIDQMVFAGAGAGFDEIPHRSITESQGVRRVQVRFDRRLTATGRLMVRLPVGGRVLPFLEGDLGLAVPNEIDQSRWLWRAGGGLDLKLGERSSLLASGGWSAFGTWGLRTGLLLDL